MTDILDRIDAAVAEQCACGCGRLLYGPSAYWASESCQRAGTRKLTGAKELPEDFAAPSTSRRTRFVGGVSSLADSFTVHIAGTPQPYQYMALSNEARQTLHTWLELHDVEPRDVPLATTIIIVGTEITIESYVRCGDGRSHEVDPATGNPRLTLLARQLREPWPLPHPERVARVVVSGVGRLYVNGRDFTGLVREFSVS